MLVFGAALGCVFGAEVAKYWTYYDASDAVGTALAWALVAFAFVVWVAEQVWSGVHLEHHPLMALRMGGWFEVLAGGALAIDEWLHGPRRPRAQAQAAVFRQRLRTNSPDISAFLERVEVQDGRVPLV